MSTYATLEIVERATETVINARDVSSAEMDAVSEEMNAELDHGLYYLRIVWH